MTGSARMLDELERVTTGDRREAVRNVRRQISVIPPMTAHGAVGPAARLHAREA